ncbi:hypothetical protein QBA57_28505 [Streptomyces scabiei]|uniref:hypothetical protein n=1 Tax=Streptomyces scabiei TaxID=1930 RepID=UPI001B32D026|nr:MULTISPECIES: hypothetical protein [Streptomyces]MDX2626830.1 hypothetical protein [Streptomyces scabiei]MDX3162767.1 hypothetical protein [Streptomyces scabiei]
MTCGRCHEPIKPSEGYDTFTPDSASVGAPTEYFHKQLCERVPRQVAPERIGLH